MNIETKNSDEKELLINDIVLEIISKYPVPILTDKILIEREAVPHSHPVLTVGTREKEPLLILKTFVHEQFHWFEAGHSKYKEAIIYLKNKYENLGDCDRGDKISDSFWQHLIVCWNTRNFLQNNLDAEEVKKIYSVHQPYPFTEKFIEENFEKVREDLEKFQMVYKNKD